MRHHISRDAISCGETPIRVTLSIGLAEARVGDTVNSLLERADAALYAAKAAGRDRVMPAEVDAGAGEPDES